MHQVIKTDGHIYNDKFLTNYFNREKCEIYVKFEIYK